MEKGVGTYWFQLLFCRDFFPTSIGNHFTQLKPIRFYLFYFNINKLQNLLIPRGNNTVPRGELLVGRHRAPWQRNHPTNLYSATCDASKAPKSFRTVRLFFLSFELCATTHLPPLSSAALTFASDYPTIRRKQTEKSIALALAPCFHNYYFPETQLMALGFGRIRRGSSRLSASSHSSEARMCLTRNSRIHAAHGFELKNPRNWTYATPDIYLSDMHDENVIRSETGAFCVVFA